MREKVIQTAIIKYLATIQNIWYVKVSDKFHKGIPDIIGCLNGKFFAVEVKAEEGVLSPLQSYTLENINRVGGCAIKASSVSEVRSMIQEMGGFKKFGA